MKRVLLILNLILVLFLLAALHGFASDQELPVIDGKEIVAMVNNEPITVEEFNRELPSLYAGHLGTAEEKQVGSIDYAGILNRLINMRLILQEARKIGLGELPEIKDMVDKYSNQTLIGLLKRQHIKDIKADEKEVDRIYKGAVKEWKIKSVMLEKEDVAKKVEAEIKTGKNFDEVVERLIADGSAKGEREGNFVKDKGLLPQIARAVSQMEIGAVSPVIKVKSGFVILKIEDIRFPENPEARERARQEALKRKKHEVLKDYENSLMKKYIIVNKDVLDALDFKSQDPGSEKLLNGKRVIAEIKGENPLTVGELTKALKQKFFHGIAKAIEGEKLNKGKYSMLYSMLQQRIFIKEALNQGIDKKEVYKKIVKEYENSLIFGAFIDKVVVPDIKLNSEELESYYNKNIKDYTFPEMIRIKSLVFEKLSDAEDALDKLVKGTDFNWLRANADGQVDKDAKGLLKFERNVLTTRGLPEAVQEAVSRAKPGDFRLYTSPEHFYVLSILDVKPSKPQPFEAVRKEITEKIFNEKLKKIIEDWADKLREFYDVKIYKTEPKK